MVYKIKAGSHIKGDPQQIGEKLEEIRSETGKIRPVDVVEDAKSDDSVLHPLFEWDDKKAAELQRLDQAGRIIRAVVIEVERENHDNLEVRAFVCVDRPANINEEEAVHTGYTYTSIDQAISDNDSRSLVIGKLVDRINEARRTLHSMEMYAALTGRADEYLQLAIDELKPAMEES